MSIEFFLSLLRTKSTDEHFRFQFESLVFFWLKIRSRLFHRIIQLVFKFSFLFVYESNSSYFLRAKYPHSSLPIENQISFNALTT